MSSWREYDVFISFRGGDTRNFAGHIYYALTSRGFHVFKDDKALDRGSLLGPELLDAIKNSKVAIVIFSKDFTSSTWCLDELAHITHCATVSKKPIVLPVFFDVEPTMVRNVSGRYGEQIQHRRSDPDCISKWKKALSYAGQKDGFNDAHRDEPSCVKSIVRKLMTKIPTHFTGNYAAIELEQKHYYDGLAKVSYLDPNPKYDVFICFRGEDTSNFAGHMEYGLTLRGFHVFKDSRGLDEDTLLGAIRKSRFAVIIFSNNFASSTRCLNVMARIVECTTGSTKLTILPVFYDIKPTMVRHASGKYGKEIERHSSNPNQILTWKKASGQAANTSGWDDVHQDEPKCVKDIVEKLMIESPAATFPAKYGVIETQQKHYFDGLAYAYRSANPK